MSVEDVLDNLKPLAELTRVTRDNVDKLLDTHQLQVHMKNGNWWDCRRNGATKLWKRSPGRIRIPIKFGFRNTGAITEIDFMYGRPKPERHGLGRDFTDGVYGSLDPLYYRVKPAPGIEDNRR